MKKLASIAISLLSLNAIGEVHNSEHTINEVQVRSGAYYATEWSDGVTLLLTPSISVVGCNAERAYFNATTDSGMLAVALAAHAQGKTVNLLLNPSEAKDTICKVELISIK